MFCILLSRSPRPYRWMLPYCCTNCTQAKRARRARVCCARWIMSVAMRQNGCGHARYGWNAAATLSQSSSERSRVCPVAERPKQPGRRGQGPRPFDARARAGPYQEEELFDEGDKMEKVGVGHVADVHELVQQGHEQGLAMVRPPADRQDGRQRRRLEHWTQRGGA